MSNSEYEPLLEILDGYWDRPLSRLPKKLKARVEKDYIPIGWGMMTAEGRKDLAAQIDGQNDPRRAKESEAWFDFYNLKSDVEDELDEVQRMNVSTPTELELKAKRVVDLRRRLAHLNGIYRRVLADSDPTKHYRVVPDQQYIPFLKAKRVLEGKFGASIDEIAMWIVFGETRLIAYKSANEIIPPPRFYFQSLNIETDYKSALQASWFGVVELETFEPEEHYILGAELLKRWDAATEGAARAFIAARVQEDRLQDLHPITGISQISEPELGYLPSLEDALFPVNEVELIEKLDLDIESPIGPNVSERKWLVENAKKANEARHDQPGGNREKRRRIQELWFSKNWASKAECSRSAAEKFHCSIRTAERALSPQSLQEFQSSQKT